MGYWMDRAKQLTGHDESFPHIPEHQTISEPRVVPAAKTTALNPLPALPLAPPLQTGWFVTYTDRQGRFCGGWEDRRNATVMSCAWTARGWSVHLSDGQAIPLAAVRCVGQTDEHGDLKAAWPVRECGLDGTNTNT